MNLLDTLPFLISYAEIHYHLKYLFPKYYLKEPEIIADLPIRVVKSRTINLPILIIIKDSHLFPILLNNIQITVNNNKNNLVKDFEFNEKINEKYNARILEIDISDFETDQYLQVLVKFDVVINGQKKAIINDNFPGIDLHSFKFYFAEKELPLPKNWFAGEPHYHSIHTSDQVEFGADISSTIKLAKAMGLDWLFVTDHSYDLDDEIDNYTHNNANLPKWKLMQRECSELDSKDFRIIAGEEVSIGNYKGKNVHLLAIDHEHFIEGYGDSAEVWFKNKPQRKLSEITKIEKGLFIAAHPNEKAPLMQKLALRRGNWTEKDYEQSKINFLQIINNANLSSVKNSILYWKNLLLKGNKFYILAGNDAHGNFNVMRQIKSPFRKLFVSYDQVFGKFFTVFNGENNEPVNGVKSGKMIVSNGPFISFYLQTNDRKFEIGSTIHCRKANLNYDAFTNPEFGEILDINLFIGNLETKVETFFKDIARNEIIDLPKRGYLRMSLKTINDGLAFTNPIWIEND